MWKDTTRRVLPAIKAVGWAVPWTRVVPAVSGVLILILGIRVWAYNATRLELVVLVLALLVAAGSGFVGFMKRRPIR